VQQFIARVLNLYPIKESDRDTEKERELYPTLYSDYSKGTIIGIPFIKSSIVHSKISQIRVSVKGLWLKPSDIPHKPPVLVRKRQLVVDKGIFGTEEKKALSMRCGTIILTLILTLTLTNSSPLFSLADMLPIDNCKSVLDEGIDEMEGEDSFSVLFAGLG
jgi:hypothetical protein